MFAELAAFAMSGEKRITDLLDELYHEYGVYDEMNTDIVLEGAGRRRKNRGPHPVLLRSASDRD